MFYTSIHLFLSTVGRMESKFRPLHISETGQPKQPLDRTFIAEELNVEEDRNSSQV